MLSYERLAKKHPFLQSFTGLTIKEFDDIYNKQIVKRYAKHEIKRLSKRENRKRSIGAGRHFKLDLKDRFLMPLGPYCLYITYTLVGFLFDLDQSSILPIPQKMYPITKRLKTPEEVEGYFPGFLAFIDCTE